MSECTVSAGREFSACVVYMCTLVLAVGGWVWSGSVRGVVRGVSVGVSVMIDL